MNAIENPFSLTRATPSASGCAIMQFLLSLFLPLSGLNAGTVNDKVASTGITFIVTNRYLNIPVAHKLDEACCVFGDEAPKMTVNLEGEPYRGPFAIRLAAAKPNYWIFYDLLNFSGKKLTLSYTGNPAGLSQIYQDNVIAGQEKLYKEPNRPQLHFTSRRGNSGDPNGLIYYEGEYHLFYQHNPWERMWGSWVWGHAVSKDLIHWEELPPALYPDELGQPYSGTAVIDYRNTAGFNKGNSPAMILFYTADNHRRGLQCMAYSVDRGRTFAKFEGNPILDSGPRWNHSRDTRDPQVFWHKPSARWVMVLYEVDGYSLYTSHNLKQWQYESHVVGLAECPQLLEFWVDGNKDDTRWVMSSARGLYLVGRFDGRKFTPEVGPLYYGDRIFAAQTFANAPTANGSRIQMAWGQIEQPDMPFNQQMLVPTEIGLRTTRRGVRLFNYPIKEFDSLQEKECRWNSLTFDQANELMRPFKGADYLRIKVVFKLTQSVNFGLNLFGQSLVRYDMEHNLINNAFYEYAPEDHTTMELSADIILDKTSVEVFLDRGVYSYNLQRRPDVQNKDGYHFWGNTVWVESVPARGNYCEIKSLSVSTMKSIWQ